MLKGKTKTGFAWTISDEAANDFEMLEVLSEVDVNPLLLPKLLEMLLGKEQKQRLMDHVRTESGTVPTTLISDEIMDIFTSQNKTKNS